MGSNEEPEKKLNVDQLINLSLFPETNEQNTKVKDDRKKRKRNSGTSVVHGRRKRTGSNKATSNGNALRLVRSSKSSRQARGIEAQPIQTLSYETVEHPAHIYILVQLPDGLNPRDLRFEFLEESKEIKITANTVQLTVPLHRPDVIVSRTAYHVIGLKLDVLELQVPKTTLRNVTADVKWDSWYGSAFTPPITYPGYYQNNQQPAYLYSPSDTSYAENGVQAAPQEQNDASNIPR